MMFLMMCILLYYGYVISLVSGVDFVHLLNLEGRLILTLTER